MSKKHLFVTVMALFFAFSPVSAQMGGNYDIGGGNNDFQDIISAINALGSQGMSAPVSFNVYSGTYRGQVRISCVIQGIGVVNPFVLQAAPGQSPRIVSNTGTSINDGNGIVIFGVDYVTIRGFEIDSCKYQGIRLYIGTGSEDSARYVTIEDNYIHNCGLTISEASIYSFHSRYCEIIGNEIQGDYYGIDNYVSSYCVIANNMVYGCTADGIRSHSTQNNVYAYNSVYMNANTPNTAHRTIFIQNSPNTEIFNNIFCNESIGNSQIYAIYLSGNFTSYPVSSDYNCFYAPSGYIGHKSSNQLTLQDWQNATQLDSHSVSVDPHFVSKINPFDLHIDVNIPSQLNAHGTPITELPVDLDGDIRDLLTPDIGADEFIPLLANYNLTLTPAILSGTSPLGGNEDYFFQITNIGDVPDSYVLSTLGADWNTAIFDSAGINPVDTLLNMLPFTNCYVKLMHFVPESVPEGAVDVGCLKARSLGNPVVSDTSLFITTTGFTGNYDIGGGNDDFPDIITAVTALTNLGMNGPVTLNVYTGTYRGQVYIPGTIQGLNQNNHLVIQAAEGQNPRIINPYGGNINTGSGFYIYGADYVTIKGMEIDSCKGNAIRVLGTSTNFDSSKYIIIKSNHFHNCGYGFNADVIYFSRARYCQISCNELIDNIHGIDIEDCQKILIDNNMIAGFGGLNTSSSFHISYYYNSVYTMSPDNESTAFCSNSSQAVILKNNIFFNNSVMTVKYAIYINGLMPKFCDYNCFYSPNGFIGRFQNADYNNLQSWRIATGLDAHSISSNPCFISGIVPYDLHIDTDSNSHVSNNGNPITDIATDFDGDLRSLISPDIGADEFTPTDAKDIEGGLSGIMDIPASFDLRQNYPNPFNASTTIAFDIPEGCEISLIAYDILGRESAVLAEGFRSAGRYEAVFDGSNLSSGIYFVVFNAPGYTMTSKIVLLK